MFRASALAKIAARNSNVCQIWQIGTGRRKMVGASRSTCKGGWDARLYRSWPARVDLGLPPIPSLVAMIDRPGSSVQSWSHHGATNVKSFRKRFQPQGLSRHGRQTSNLWGSVFHSQSWSHHGATNVKSFGIWFPATAPNDSSSLVVFAVSLSVVFTSTSNWSRTHTRCTAESISGTQPHSAMLFNPSHFASEADLRRRIGNAIRTESQDCSRVML